MLCVEIAIGLVTRGGCPFAQKVIHLYEWGAKAALIINENDVDGKALSVHRLKNCFALPDLPLMSAVDYYSPLAQKKIGIPSGLGQHIVGQAIIQILSHVSKRVCELCLNSSFFSLSS